MEVAMMERHFRHLFAALGIGISLYCASSLLAESPRSTAVQQETARKVCEVLQQGHISRRAFDDEISKRVHRELLKSFDPRKLYFLQSDIDEFAAGELRHDDRLLEGDVAFVSNVHQRFKVRLQERTTLAQELAEAKFDFDHEESLEVDPDASTYAANHEQAIDRWRRWIRYELIEMMVNGEKEAEARDRIKRRYRNVQRRWQQLDSQELLELYLSALASSFDPHTSFMGAKTLENFNINIQLSLEGIGAVLRDLDGATVVQEIVSGGSADRDGRLKPGDKIVGVGQGENGEIVDVVEMKLDDVVGLIRGKAGTTVRLEVIAAAENKRVIYALRRQKIELTERGARGRIVETPTDGSDKPFRVGVIHLPSFYADSGGLLAATGLRAARSATNDVRRILDDFKSKGVDAVVVDLRANGGGLLSEAIDLTGLFVHDGPIVQVKDFSGKIERYDDGDAGIAYAGPLAVLVSKYSASASEIFAGAIQDYRRGVIIGDSSTHGKGSVQKVLELNRFSNLLGANSGAIKLTMQLFYRVNGESTQSRGVLADIVLPSASDQDEFSEAKFDYALAFDQIPAAKFKPFNLSSPELVAELREKSQRRQSADPELNKLAQRRDLLRHRLDRKRLTVSQRLLRQERDAMGSSKDEENEDPEFPEPGKQTAKKPEKPFGSDPYSREVLSIMRDYLQRLRVASNGR
jgi:carboxyl-terminal processing protease